MLTHSFEALVGLGNLKGNCQVFIPPEHSLSGGELRSKLVAEHCCGQNFELGRWFCREWIRALRFAMKLVLLCFAYDCRHVKCVHVYQCCDNESSSQ